MSHTDKDRPYWVRSRDRHEVTVEVHFHEMRTWLRSRGLVDNGVCDLHVFDRPADPYNERWSTACHRDIPHWASGGSFFTSPPRWFIRDIWHAPERTREKNTLRNAAKEYNAGEDLDDFDFPNYQSRHSARWYWE